MENTRELAGLPPGPDGRAPDGLACDPIHDVSVARAAQVLGLGRTTVYRRVESGQIPAYRCHRRWLIPRAFLQGVLAQHAGHPAPRGGQAALADPSGAPLDAPVTPAMPPPARLSLAALASQTSPAPAQADEPVPAAAEARQELLNVLAAWLDALGCSYEPVLLGVLEDVLRQYAAWLRAGSSATAAHRQTEAPSPTESGERRAVSSAQRRAGERE
jgi:excisionase family DNA binding protein